MTEKATGHRSKTNALLLCCVALGIFSVILHFKVVPNIAWLQNGISYDGWQGIIRAWPSYTTLGAFTGFIGLMLGYTVAESAKERDAKRASEQDRQAASEAREAAENAMTNAEAALKPRWDKLVRSEQEMRVSIARADATRDAADREAVKGRERIEELEQKNARLGSDLYACRDKGERGKKKHDECIAERNHLKDQLAASANAHATIEQLKSELQDTRVRLHKAEQE